MLAKCLKYDLRSTFTFWWIGAVTTLALGGITALFIRNFFADISSTGAENVNFPWWVFLLIAWMFVSIAFIIVISILVYVRFYKQFFSDEAYLTFTLPVKRSTHLMSKVLSGSMMMTGATLVFIISFILIFCMIPDFGTLFEAYGITFDFANLPFTVAIIAEVLILFILATTFGLQVMYLCITLGHMLTKKYTVLVIIGLMYGYEFVMQIITTVGSVLGAMWLSAATTVFPAHDIAGGTDLPAVSLLLLLGCVVYAALNVLVHFITLGCIERKLNLA